MLKNNLKLIPPPPNQMEHMFFPIFFCLKYVNNYLDLEGIIMKGLISKRLLLIYRVL